MVKHLKYLSYVIRHKCFVFYAGLVLEAPLFRLIIHDWSKFLPSEWFAYTNFFYGGEKTLERKESFNLAWLFHQRRNKHHYQYWILKQDSGEEIPQPMPARYVREMIADWCGAGRAITGKWEVSTWYQKNKEKIVLHPVTRSQVEFFIRYFQARIK